MSKETLQQRSEAGGESNHAGTWQKNCSRRNASEKFLRQEHRQYGKDSKDTPARAGWVRGAARRHEG